MFAADAGVGGFLCISMVVALGGVAWMLYMMTFKTQAFLSLMKADQEAKERRHERMTGTAKGLFKVASFFLKR